ncbi:MAG: UDP-glucose--hexose-1-phosphate uridylyltransferase [Ruminococcaceae bacterium]|nr:UDP-glucose--hexose-1-phosphate uridylyltransferase [Oscillospiraceae bacterium]
MQINYEISRLAKYALDNGLIGEQDKDYCINRVLAKLGLDEFEAVEILPESPELPQEILDNILDWAFENGVLADNGITARDIFDTELMDCFMPLPSEVQRRFFELYAEDKKAATDFYYNLSYKSNYIRMDRIRKNMVWTADTKYGDIIISINLSKPEKDSKAIAAALNSKQSSYPKCLLCKENVGYKGTMTHPARANHRIIPIDVIEDESWFMQYSPYVYYNEHCIVFKGAHEPMNITKKTFERLLGFVDSMPHYFLGSNAGLPIVGGSILTHDHYQGGNFEFPMAKAPVDQPIAISQFPSVEAGLVKWPMSVIRIRHESKEVLADCADYINKVWGAYTDEAAFIFAETDGIPHNAITPICRFRGGKFELDLVLRNNITTEQYPDGYYHPHPKYHHIKKENIGLIEVMGLAILPARLKDSIAKLEIALNDESKAEEIFAAQDMQILRLVPGT